MDESPIDSDAVNQIKTNLERFIVENASTILSQVEEYGDTEIPRVPLVDDYLSTLASRYHNKFLREVIRHLRDEFYHSNLPKLYVEHTYRRQNTR